MSDEWVDAGPVTELDAEYPLAKRVAGVEVALHLVDGQVYATSNVCTHADAKLSDGVIEGFEVLCPLHGGSFDVRTGEAVRPPCVEPIATYRTKVESGRVLVCPFAPRTTE